jgi:hypothetical protein
MPNSTFRRWTAEDVAKLEHLARNRPLNEIAALLGRSATATAVKAHELKLSLRMHRQQSQALIDPGPSGIELPE